IHCAGVRVDADEDASAILGNGNVIGSTAEGYFLQHLAALGVDDVEHRFRLVADIDAGSVRSKGDTMRELYAANDLHDLVCGGVDHVDGVAGTVGHIDSHLRAELRLRHDI